MMLFNEDSEYRYIIMAWEVGLIGDGWHFQRESIALGSVLYQDPSI